MRYLLLTLCSTALSCHLMAEEEPAETSTLFFELGEITAPLSFYTDSWDPKQELPIILPGGQRVEEKDRIVKIEKVETMPSNSSIGTYAATISVGCVTTSSSQNGNPGSVTFTGKPIFITSGRYFKDDPEYAKYLPIRHFILSEPQMAQFFSEFPLSPKPLDFCGLPESNLYLIVQIKNNGPCSAYGILNFPFWGKPFSIAVDLLDREIKDFVTYVVPLGMADKKDFEDSEDVKELLDGLMWDDLSVGLTEEEFSKQWETDLEKAQREGKTIIEYIGNAEGTPHFFPVFRSYE